jgi:hypothetical protein
MNADLFKPKRFVREYANHKLEMLQWVAESYKDEYQNEFKKKRIMKAVESYENGFISADDAVMTIAQE